MLKHEEEAREVLEFHMGLQTQSYAKKIQGFRLPFGTQQKKGEYDPTSGKKEATSGGTTTRFQTLPNAANTTNVKEEV